MTPHQTYLYAYDLYRARAGRDPDSGELIDTLCDMASEAWNGASWGFHRRFPAVPVRPARPQRPAITDDEPETATE